MSYRNHAPRGNQEILNNSCYSDKFKVHIHTTIPIQVYKWMMQHAADNGQNLNDTIIMLYEFYKNNKELPERYEQGILTLRQIIQDEIKKVNIVTEQ